MRCPRYPRFSLRPPAHVVLVGFAFLFSADPIAAQAPPSEDSEAEIAGGEPIDANQIDRWVEMLGSQRFAVRERAAMGLMRQGESVLPKLKQLVDSTADPEVRLRASELAKQIGRGDMEARITAFLAGKSDNLDGWSNATRFLREDSGSIRQLYVELVKAHPDIALSLEGESRDRAIAMEAAFTRVQRARVSQGRFPSRADAVALLFPLYPWNVNDVPVPISVGYEEFLIWVLNTEAGTALYKSDTLAPAYQRLVTGWAMRSGMKNRPDVLWLLMSHNVAQALQLATDTLTETSDPETLAIALQAIARFGDHSQAAAITHLLHDDRAVIEHGFVRGKVSRTELGDVAMATLALLYDIPLGEVGFGGNAADPTFGFRKEDIGFEVSDRTRREKTLKRLMAKVSEKSDANREPIPLLVE